MSYKAMVLLICAICAALFGFSGAEGPLVRTAQLIAVGSAVVFAVSMALPFFSRPWDDRDDA